MKNMFKYRQGISVIILIAVLVLVVATPLQSAVKLILMALALVIIGFNSRGNASYAKANKIVAARDMSRMDEAVALYSKAVKAGISSNYRLMAGTIILQYGDIEEGRRILEKLNDDRNKDVRCVSKLSLSMYYWIRKDLGKAIGLCEETRSEGYRNQNLYVNLCTYYLAEHNQKQFLRTLKEAFSGNMASIPLIDLQAVHLMLQDNWKDAGGTLKGIFDQVTPSFPDPYVHMAQVKLHYGNVKDAVEYLKSGLGCIFSNTVLFDKSMLEKMLEGLGNENTRLDWVEGINNNTEAIINGNLPAVGTGGRPCSDMVVPGYPKEPVFKSGGSQSAISRNVGDGDDRDVDTELNEEDEKWLRRHSGN